MRLEIKPLDTVFFRDGKPFSMGEESWANGMFPPNPSVFAGVLRTIYMTAKGKSAKEVLIETKDLIIKDIRLRKDNYLFPFPSDIVQLGKNENIEYLPLYLEPKPDISSNELPGILSNQKNEKVIALSGKAFISKIDLKKYLENGIIEEVVRLNELTTLESKVGIGRNNLTHIVNESMLYRVNMMRMEPCYKTKPFSNLNDSMKFVIEFEQFPDIPLAGICNLGAEGKKAEYTILDEEDNETDYNVSLPKISSNLLKLYLATPAIFSNGAIPDWMSEPIELANGEKVGIKLLACSIGKPIKIGGFDIANRIPKPMYSAVPAGSVYYLEIQKPKDQKSDDQEFKNRVTSVAEQLHGSHISKINKELGYGLCYVGNVKFANQTQI